MWTPPTTGSPGCWWQQKGSARRSPPTTSTASCWPRSWARCGAIRGSSRCSMGWGGSCSGSWHPPGTRCGSTCPMATPGTPISPAGWRSVLPTCGSSCGPCSGAEAGRVRDDPDHLLLRRWSAPPLPCSSCRYSLWPPRRTPGSMSMR